MHDWITIRTMNSSMQACKKKIKKNKRITCFYFFPSHPLLVQRWHTSVVCTRKRHMLHIKIHNVLYRLEREKKFMYNCTLWPPGSNEKWKDFTLWSGYNFFIFYSLRDLPPRVWIYESFTVTFRFWTKKSFQNIFKVSI